MDEMRRQAILHALLGPMNAQKFRAMFTGEQVNPYRNPDLPNVNATPAPNAHPASPTGNVIGVRG